MKIAFVVATNADELRPARFSPPLALAYAAALLEQQRHIVRMYDLAIMRSAILTEQLRPVVAYRPQVIVIVAPQLAILDELTKELTSCEASIIPMQASFRDPDLEAAIDQALAAVEIGAARRYEETLVYSSLLALDDHLDELPFPARHLLAIEQYPLFTLDGELQTPILVGRRSHDQLLIREPTMVLAEMQSVVQEYGIRHFVFTAPIMTELTSGWNDLLGKLAATSLGSCWEVRVAPQLVTTQTLQLFRRAGCEQIEFELTAEDLLQSSRRTTIKHAANLAREHRLGTRALITLHPPYTVLENLVDLSASFSFDRAHFRVISEAAVAERAVGDELSSDELAERAQDRYRSSRSRQVFVDLFGPQVGPVLWRLRQMGMFGRAIRRLTGLHNATLLPN